MLRGMTLDPAIPAHAKEVMTERYREIEALLEGYADDADPEDMEE